MPAVYRHYESLGHVIEWYESAGLGSNVYDINSVTKIDCDGKINDGVVDMDVDRVYGRCGLRRRIMRCNSVRCRCASEYDFMMWVNMMIASINMRLYVLAFGNMMCGGGSDVVSDHSLGVAIGGGAAMGGGDMGRVDVGRGVVSVSRGEVVRRLADKFVYEKSKELRPDTIRSYESWCKIFCEWLDGRGVKYVGELSRSLCADFMFYCSDVRGVSNTSWNNYLKYGKVFMSWCVEMGLMDVNWFEGMRRKIVGEKKRVLIPREERVRFVEWCDRSNWRGFAVVGMLVYGSLIRPKEIRKIRVGDVNLDEGYIMIDGGVAKNRRSRMAVISVEVSERLREMRLERYPRSWFLFGSHLVPAECEAGRGCFIDLWSRVRDELGWSDRYKLYSLRDTGISEMLESGIPSVDVMKLADHSSLEITSVYAKHKDLGLVDKIRKRAPRFGE